MPPSVLQQQGSAAHPRKVAAPATECEVELREGMTIISNELKTKRRARESIGDENGRREGERRPVLTRKLTSPPLSPSPAMTCEGSSGSWVLGSLHWAFKGGALKGGEVEGGDQTRKSGAPKGGAFKGGAFKGGP